MNAITVCQEMMRMLENKVFQKLELAKIDIVKKCASKQLFSIEKKCERFR